MSRAMNRCQRGLHETVAPIAIALSFFLCATSSVIAQPASMKQKDEAVAVARKTLSAALSTPVDRWQLVSVTPAEWRDSSLGCPERGKVYTPAITSGFKVTLRGDDREHVVHVAGGRGVVCASKGDARLGPGALVDSSMSAGDAVRAELARERKIAPEAVRIISVRPARRADPCMPATPAGAAFIVEARIDGKTRRYYKDDAAVRPCEPETKP
jgi:hypothetical protein